MGVLMVRNDVKRRTSLLMGISLALLLGAAAAFFIFALPQSLLESLTTATGLSRIMVQAEPPISPNDRVLLSALAGIGTAGIGWVLIDWLLFGRAGMSAIIKPREDDYEEDEGDYYRPSNPLDLVIPDGFAANLSAPPAPPVLDPRRPLSARTDIGDPPASPMAAGRPEDIYDIALNQVLPPIGQLLPEAPPTPATPPDGADAVSRVKAILTPAPADVLSSFDEPADIEPVRKTPRPLILPTAAAIAAGTGEAPIPQASVIIAPAPSPDPLFDGPVIPVPAIEQPPQREADAPLDFSLNRKIEPQPMSPPSPPVAGLGLGADLLTDFSASFPPDLADAAITDPPFITLAADVPLHQADLPPEIPPAAPVASKSDADVVAKFDHTPLAELLARLESGMRKRRPKAPPPITLESVLPAAMMRRPLPAYAAAPAQMINPPPPPITPPDPIYAPPPQSTVIAEPQAMPPAIAPDHNGLLDQPLHVALDVLRNRVRRSS